MAKKRAAGGRGAPARVVIVDDHPVFRRGLIHLLGEAPGLEVVAEASGAAEAMAVIGRCGPDLAILDLSLGDGSGLELIKQVRAVHADLAILVCSMHEERIYGERVMHAGANGYLSKDQAADDVIEAALTVLRGKTWLSEELTERLLQRRLRGADNGSNEPHELLTDRELEVFALLGEGLSSKRIGDRLSLSPKTIDTHREHMKAKLGAGDNAELIRRATEWNLRRQKA